MQPSYSAQETSKQPASNSLPTILFVCEHGAAKSVIAAAYFNKLAKQRGINYQAISRGTSPDPMLSPATEKGLKEDGIDITSLKPVLITDNDLDQAAQIITFACPLPNNTALKGKVTEWNNVPAVSEDYQTARNEILRRVEQLMEKLTK
ncbi:MAG: hypothetical protein AB1489_11395 [Acidobacteriota bacterium]